jgi:hypothetical protein
MSNDAWVTIKQHWCLTEDGDRVVPDSDPEARWLHWTPGMLVSREEAERLGAVEPAATPEPKKAAAPAVKKATPAENKAMYPPQNKRR